MLIIVSYHLPPAYMHKLMILEMDVMMEETFGPVVGIMKVESDEEALSLMNDSPYGLVSHQFLVSIASADD